MAQLDPRTDEALVEAANGGDEGAFEALYRRYRDWVVRRAYRLTGSDADASILPGIKRFGIFHEPYCPRGCYTRGDCP